MVWDGSFGADVKEMRMPLPGLYPSSSTPYDQNEDFAARTLGEAIVSLVLRRKRSALPIIHLQRDQKQFHRTRVSLKQSGRLLLHQPNLFAAHMASILVSKQRQEETCIYCTSPRLNRPCCGFLVISRACHHATVSTFPPCKPSGTK